MSGSYQFMRFSVYLRFLFVVILFAATQLSNLSQNLTPFKPTKILCVVMIFVSTLLFLIHVTYYLLLNYIKIKPFLIWIQNITKLALPIFLLMFPSLVNGYPEITKTFGDISLNYGRAIVTIPSGGYYVGGMYNFVTSPNYKSAYILKLDEVGSLIWQAKFNYDQNDYSYGVAVTSDGGVISVGYGYYYCSPDGYGYVPLIIKLYSNGAIDFRKNICGYYRAMGVSVASNGEYLIAGDDLTYGFIGRLRTDGSTKWIYKDNLSTTLMRKVIENSDGTIIAVGAESKCYLLKVTDTGNFMLRTLYTYGGYSAYCPGLVKLSDGLLIIVGYVYVPGNNNNAFIQKTDTSGNIIWAKSFGKTNSEYVYNAVIMPNGNIIGIGRRMSLTPGIYYLWIWTADPNGDFIRESIQGDENDFYFGYDIAVTSDSKVACIGEATLYGTGIRNIYFLIREGCSAGSYLSASDDLCYPCPPGFYSIAINVPNCTPCPPGTYQDSAGSANCIPCPIGRANPLPGQLICPECVPGYHVAGTGFLNCNACIAGKFQPLYGQSGCNICPAGQFTANPGAPTCFKCPAGYVQQYTQSTGCNSCSPGYYMDIEGQTVCKICDYGTYQPNTGQTSCITCTPGHYQDTQGASNYKECPLMQYQDEPGKNGCKSCAPGFFTDLLGQSKCSCIF